MQDEDPISCPLSLSRQDFSDTAGVMIIIFDKVCSFSLNVYQGLGIFSFVRVPYCGRREPQLAARNEWVKYESGNQKQCNTGRNS